MNLINIFFSETGNTSLNGILYLFFFRKNVFLLLSRFYLCKSYRNKIHVVHFRGKDFTLFSVDTKLQITKKRNQANMKQSSFRKRLQKKYSCN